MYDKKQKHDAMDTCTMKLPDTDNLPMVSNITQNIDINTETSIANIKVMTKIMKM